MSDELAMAPVLVIAKTPSKTEATPEYGLAESSTSVPPPVFISGIVPERNV